MPGELRATKLGCSGPGDKGTSSIPVPSLPLQAPLARYTLVFLQDLMTVWDALNQSLSLLLILAVTHYHWPASGVPSQVRLHPQVWHPLAQEQLVRSLSDD